MEHGRKNAPLMLMTDGMFIIVIVTALIIIGSSTANAATLTGTVYTQDLEVARYSLLTINSTPTQRTILEDGAYDIILQEGTYTMRVTYNTAGRAYEDEHEVTITDDSTYTYDFILFPIIATNEEKLPDIDDITTMPQAPDTTQYTTQSISIGAWPMAILIIVLIALVTFFGQRRWGQLTTKERAAKEKKDDIERMEDGKLDPPMKEDLAALLTIIEKEGGRTTQKELRQKMPYSEAKISMMLTELEASGKIKRHKKGRSNVIALK